MNRSKKVADYFRRIMKDSRHSLLEASDGALESLVPTHTASGREGLDALDAIHHVRNEEDLSSAEVGALEAIIHREGRPAIDIRDDTYTDVPFEWREQLEEAKPLLRTRIPAIGRVQSNRPYALYDGTAFVVGPKLLMTNRHVAEKFIRDVGETTLTFKPFHTAKVDLKVERGRDTTRVLQVIGAKLVHPYWDMALLEVEGLDPSIEPLRLITRPLTESKAVAVIGYPYFDERNPDAELQNRIFQSEYGVKRLLPGYTGARAKIVTYGGVVDVITHDSSTLGGNSGSALIDLETGEVLGLHFAGDYLEDNYAVPAWELAADVRVRKRSVAFGKGEFEPERAEVIAAWRSLAPATPTAESPSAAVIGPAADSPLPPDFFASMDEAAIVEALERDPERTQARIREVLGDEEANDFFADLQAASQEGPAKIDPNLPEIIWVHGIMGGHLTQRGPRRKRLWLRAAPLIAQPLGRLLALADDGIRDRSPGGAITPDGYLELIYRKAERKWGREGFVVHEFSYDWRKSISQCANRLHHFIETLRIDRPNRRFALVAHSMGGLICAAYASQHRHEFAAAIDRAALLGCPLRGSFAPIQAIEGTYPFLRRLDKVALNTSIDELADMARTLPGLIDMLPDPDLFAADRVYASAAWPKRAPLQRWLNQSRQLKHLLRDSPLFELATCFVSLHHRTVVSLRNGDSVVAGPATGAGDGTVPARSCVLPEVPAFKVQKQHQQIAKDPLAIQGVAQLLRDGQVDLPRVQESELDVTFAAEEAVEQELPEQAYREIAARLERELTMRDLDWLFSGDTR